MFSSREDGGFSQSTERIPLGITVCDTGLTVIFSAVTPPYERCPRVSARGFEKYTFQLKEKKAAACLLQAMLRLEFIGRASRPFSAPNLSSKPVLRSGI